MSQYAPLFAPHRCSYPNYNQYSTKTHSNQTVRVSFYFARAKGLEGERQLKILLLIFRIFTSFITYHKEKSSLGFPDHTYALISIGIGFAGLEIDPETKKVIGVKGLLPRSIWLKKKLKTPNSKKGVLTIRTSGVEIRNKTYIQICKQEDSYYDSKSGWLCIGERKTYDFDDCIEFLNGVIIVLRDNKVVSIWFNVGADLPLF